MDLLRRLPLHVGRSVIEYFDPRTSNIKFRKMTREWAERTNYHCKYKMAYIEDPDLGELPLRKPLITKRTSKTTLFLSKISKKKTHKDRYYLTFQTVEEECNSCGQPSCSGRYCDGDMFNETSYYSRFVGNSVEVALAEFYKYQLPIKVKVDK